MKEWIDALQSTCNSLLNDKLEDASANAPLSVRQSSLRETDPVPIGRASSSDPEIKAQQKVSQISQFIVENNKCNECTKSITGLLTKNENFWYLSRFM